ncbi:MAG: dual OB domain-containing protein [Sulfuriferula sp.]
MDWKTIVVLAKSYKNNKWCIAGRELIKAENGKYQIHGWVRPTSEEQHGAISSQQCILNIGREVQVLDIVRVPIAMHAPTSGQPENYRIDDSTWQYERIFPSGYLSKLIEKPINIWLEDEDESDSVSSIYVEQESINHSLFLIKPELLCVKLALNWNDHDQKYKGKMSAEFQYAGKAYSGLSITDPKVRKMLKNQFPEEGTEPRTVKLIKEDNYYLCVSLGPLFGYENRHYKFVAAIFDFDGYLQNNY